MPSTSLGSNQSINSSMLILLAMQYMLIYIVVTLLQISIANMRGTYKNIMLCIACRYVG